MTGQLHTRASCLTPGCPWDADGPDADRKASAHSASKAKGAVHHPTVTSTHPTTNCDRMGCHR